MTEPTAREKALSELADLLREWEDATKYNRLVVYGPDGIFVPVAKQMDFLAAGAGFQQRCFMANNQGGKTVTAAHETAMHLTGMYPDWWVGKRWYTPVKGWACGVTGTATRDTVQAKIMGEGSEWGSGTIPQHLIIGDPIMARTVPNAVDFVQVRHVPTGGTSTLWFKSYDQGRERHQGATLHFIWDDEEPPEDIFVEHLTRLNYYKGTYYLTFTPLLGMTNVVRRFMEPDPKDPGAKERILIHMTLADCTFYTPEQRAVIEAQYDVLERQARAQGLPVIGSGLVYPVTDDSIIEAPFQVPSHWRRIIGLDLGIDHPTAAVLLVYNDETDTLHLTHEYKAKSYSVAEHARAILAMGGLAPVAWPHDGLKREPKSGENFATMYNNAGVQMLGISARYEDDKGGGQSAEPIVADLLQRMKDGRFRVWSTCREWLREKATHYRKDNQIVRQNDDLMSATRYGAMMLRFAQPKLRVPHPATAPEWEPLDQ